MEILIRNQQKKIPLTPQAIIRTVRTVLRSEKVKTAALSIVFITDRKIQSLNKKFLKRGYATDVLAFDLTPERLSFSKGKVKRIEGDIFISTDTVARNAKLYGKTPKEELTLCVVHGILHLLGYNDHAAGDIKRMRKKEGELLRKLSTQINLRG